MENQLDESISLNIQGFTQLSVILPRAEILKMLKKGDYGSVDHVLGKMLLEGGVLYENFSKITKIEKTEYLLSIRNGDNDEEGIWHDDGSRELAFTLSLMEYPQRIEGGELLVRKKGPDSPIFIVPPAPFGTLTILRTGQNGYEHMVRKVEVGPRIQFVGWIN